MGEYVLRTLDLPSNLGCSAAWPLFVKSGVNTGLGFSIHLDEALGCQQMVDGTWCERKILTLDSCMFQVSFLSE